MSFQARIQPVWERLQQPPKLAPLFLTALMIYLGIAWCFIFANAPWSPDEGAKYLQLTSLRLEGGKLALDIPYGGLGLDPSLEFALSEHPKDLLRVVGNQLTFERLPIFPLAVWPFYRMLGAHGLSFLPAVFGAYCGILTLLLLESSYRRLSMWAAVALGSPIVIYSTLFWEHTFATVMALGGAWLILRDLRDSARSTTARAARWILGGCALGAAAYIRLETLLFSGALLVGCWLLIPQRRSSVLLAGLVLIVTLLPYRSAHRAWFHGQPLPNNARYLNLPLAYLRTFQWRAIPDLLIGPPEEGGIEPGWQGTLWSLAALAAVALSTPLTPTRTARILQQGGLLVCAMMAGYFLFTPTPYRAAHGLLFTTPWALLGYTRSSEIWARGEPYLRVIVFTVLLGLGGYAVIILGVRASSPHGGLEWGARFFLTFYALLALIAAWDWKHKPWVERMLMIVLILLGIAFQMRGLLSIRNDREINAALDQAILELPEDHILTDLWWLTLNAAPIYQEKEIYTIKSPSEGGKWISLANKQGMRSFSLVTLDHALPAHINSTTQAAEIEIVELIQVQDLLIYRLELDQP